VKVNGEKPMNPYILTILCTIVSIVITLLVSQIFVEYVKRKKLIITWKYFFKTLTNENFLRAISGNDWKPDIIIGLNNGIVPASIIATNYGIEEIYYYHMFPRIDRDGCRLSPILNDRKIDFNNKNVLIIDDQSCTGRSMEALYNHLITMDGANQALIKRAAIFEYVGLDRVRLDIPAPGKIQGAIKKIPWSFLPEHASLSTHGTCQ
jgi:hypoxanthine phosphoribosyltransferase